MESITNYPKFLPDEPEKEGKDILNRKGFAKRLAAKILEFENSDCLIIGIHGPWGSGKTTFLMYLEDEMVNRSDNIVIVHFNPWNFSSIDQLITMFFNELKLAICKGSELRGVTLEISKGLDNLSKILAPIEAAGSLIALISSLTIPSCVPSTLDKASLALKQLAEQDPSDLRRELNELLDKYGKKMIILVDDIDRLDRDSMRLMFRLIRLNADFMNTIYILSFDRKIVENALTGEQGTSGREYLEKFIQVPFDLPYVENKIIIEILRKQIVAILPSSVDKKFKSYRWIMLNDEFNSFFNTLRDVKRYVNGLLLTLPSIDEEIDYLDFIALEAIRIFEPDVYSAISNNRELFLGNKRQFSLDLSSDELASRKEKINDVVKLANNAHQSAVKGIILNLFPHAGEGAFHGYGSQYRKEKRICSSYRFDNYFQLALAEGELSQANIDNALNSMNDKGSFIRLMVEYKKQEMIMQFLNRVADYTNDIPIERINNVINAFFDIGDEIIEKPNGRINHDAQMRIGYAILALVEKMHDANKRAEVLTECMEHTKGFCIPIFTAFLVGQEVKKNIDFLPNEGFQTIKNLIAEKIRTAASEDDFIERPNAGAILFRWKEVSDVNEPKAFVSRLIADDQGLIRLLTRFLMESSTINEPECHYIFNDMSIRELSEFVDLSSISPRIISIKQMKPDLIKYGLEEIAINGFIENYVTHNRESSS